MASNNNSDSIARITRIQEATAKRKAVEELVQQAELKRQKEIFAPRQVTGVRDIVVNSNHLKIKREEDLWYSSTVKLEPLEVESYFVDEFQDNIVNSIFPEVKREFNESLVVKVEETLDLEMSSSVEQFSERIPASFEMVLPFLYTELQLNEILACRSVCHCWQDAVDSFLNTNPSKLPFNNEIQLKEERKLMMGRIPTWNESPLQKLSRTYKFSSLPQLNSFIRNGKAKIVGSTVSFDNISIQRKCRVDSLKTFVKSFGVHIKYLTINQCVEPADLKLLQERVNLCLVQLPNLKAFTLMTFVAIDKIAERNSWQNSMPEGTEKTRQICTYPKSNYLESLVVGVENCAGIKQKIIKTFASNLINSYLKQLKQLGILTNGICSSTCLVAPNLKQLTITQKGLRRLDIECNSLQKCTVLNDGHKLQYNDIIIIQRSFPNLVCLGFKFAYFGVDVYDYLWKISPKFQNINTLELENWGVVKLSMICCFPNLRYLKLTNKHRSKLLDCRDDGTVLCITQLCRGRNLYKLPLFWEKFPNISVVTLACTWESMIKREPKICAWTRQDYVRHWSNTQQSLFRTQK